MKTGKIGLKVFLREFMALYNIVTCTLKMESVQRVK